MVRETRYLLVGNLPETTTENEITEYFKRFGKIQKVKLERRPEESSTEKEQEKEEGIITSLTATVAFTDIKSASNAHKAEKKLGNNILTSDYSEGFGATGSVVTRTHEPEIYPRVPPPGTFTPNRKGFEEEADGFDVYYGSSTPQFIEPPYPSPTYAERGRPRERWVPGGPSFPGRGAKWTGAPRPYTDASGKDGFEKAKATSSISASSPTHPPASQPVTDKHRKKTKESKSVDRSRSSSGSSRSSSSSSCSGSASSSKERPKSAVASTVAQRSDTQDSTGCEKETEIEPGEREPLGIYITKLPLRSSDTSLRDGLFHEYKKYGKITALQVSGVAETRYSIISFKQSEDAAKALVGSKDKRFFGTLIHVVQHEGIEVEDSEFSTPEAQLDEHSPKATRTLFLGNLEKEITIEELKEKLEKYGEILDVDVKRQGAVSAYAFIQFSDISSVVRALRDLDGMSWGVNKLKVGFGKSMATSVIWLDNLAETVNEGFLCRQFGRFGGISHTVVDRVKGRGLVFFMNIESAQYALPEMRNRIWNGKKIHIDYASRDVQESFFTKMEASGQLRPGERPDQGWMHKQIQNDPYTAETGSGAGTSTSGSVDPARRGNFNQFGRGRGRFQRGRGAFRGRGGSFDGGHPASGNKEFPGRRKQFDEFSQSSGPYMETEDSYEQELREYGHSQRERRDRSSQSPPGYPDDMYYEAGSQSGIGTSREFDVYDKHRYDSYRSLSPGSDREMDINDEEYTNKYKTRTPSDERYYYKEKYYEDNKSRDRSHSSDSEHRYRLSSEIVRRSSRSRSPTIKHKRTKELPISYRSPSPPTPTDDEPQSYYHDSGDHSPTDFDSAYRKYGDYKKRLSSSSIDGDKKSSVLLTTGLRKEIESKSEERTSRKRSYDQLSPKRSDSLHRLERQHSRGSRSGSMYDYERNEKLSTKELLSKVARLKSEVHERTMGKDSPSSGSSHSDIDPSTMSEAELAKLHREKQKLLEKLTLLEDTGNNSDGDSNGDTRRVVSKKARVDLAQSGLVKYLHKSDSLATLTKHELKEKLKMMDMTQSCRKQMEALRKKELLREIKKCKSMSDSSKKDMLDYSDEDEAALNSPRDIPSGFMPKKRRKVEGESDRKGRSYRGHHDDDDPGFSSDDEKRDLLQRQISVHSDLFSRTRSSGMDVRLENDSLFSSHTNESRRISSGSDTNKEHGEQSGRSHRRRKHKKDDHITPLIPLGDDDMPDPETSDPRVLREKSENPMVLPLPDFAQFIQFSPLPSPHHSPERYSDLPLDSNIDKIHDSASGIADAGSSNQPYQSPCFSPQSSSSKTHSPSQSPSGSGSDSKANTNSDSGDIPLGFPTETEQIDPLDENKPESLDSVPDPTKLTEASKEDDSFSDNNSDMDINLSSDNLSIEERIRRLDEKWNKSQAAIAATPKLIPDVESVVNSSSVSSVLIPLSVLTPITSSATVTSPSMSSLYSKFRIRKKNEPSGTEGDKSEPSEIVQTMLSKSSIFDQDSKRLGQMSDGYETKDLNTVCESSPKVTSAWTAKVDEKESNPMVTVPGSLMDRLGQSGHNVSFPTLNVNTSFTNSVLSNNGNGSSKSELLNSNLLLSPKMSPHVNLSDPRLDKNSEGNSNLLLTPMKNTPSTEELLILNSSTLPNEALDLQPPVLETPPKASPKLFCDNDKEISAGDIESGQVPDLSKQISTPVNDLNSEKSLISSNSQDCSDFLKNGEKDLPIHSNVKSSNDKKMDLSEKMILLANENLESTDKSVNSISEVTKIKTENNFKSEKVSENVDISNSVGAINEKDPRTTENISSVSHKSKLDIYSVSAKKDSVKKELKREASEDTSNTKDPSLRSAFDADIFGMSTPLNLGKRKVEEIKSDLETEIKHETKTDNKNINMDKTESKIDIETGKESMKVGQKEDSLQVKEKHSHRDSSNSKSEKRDISKEPSSKKQKMSKDKDKKSDSSHKDDKHKKKDSEKKGESSSSHKSSGEKKDDKKDKHKSKTDKDKDKKDNDKKVKEESDKKSKEDNEKKAKEENDKKAKEDKDKKDEKKKKSEKKEKEKKEDKKEHHEEKKEKSAEKKEKDKSEKKEKEKHDKKEGHRHDKHKNKSPEKRSKSSSREGENKDMSKDTTTKSEIQKAEGSKDELSKDEANKDGDKEKTEKNEKKSSEQTSKREHKKSSSHKAKKSKDPGSGSKKSKADENKKAKDDHSEHKKKDEINDKNNKDSPDKNKDIDRKTTSESKKETSSEKSKEKETSAENCKEQKTKEKENKDKDPDVSKSKARSSSGGMSEKNRHQSGDLKSKAETDKGEDISKEDKKSKDASVTKSLSMSSSKSSSKDKEKSDSQKKTSNKSEKSSKTKTNESKTESKSKEKSDVKDADSQQKERKETKEKETPKKCSENGLTEEDMAIFAQFSEPYMSMYDKVKRRSTDKKIKTIKEQEDQKKLLSEYKRSNKGKKLNLSDITESSDLSSDEEKKKKLQKTKKKFAFSSGDSDSSSGEDLIRNKAKTKVQSKKPKRISDIYSSDSDSEDNLKAKSPSKKSSTGKLKKNDFLKSSEHNFDFDSLSDSDHKTSSTKQAKSKTVIKSTKKQKSKQDSTPLKTKDKDDKNLLKPKTQRKDLNFKDLFSDDSDDSLLSDSDSDSDIMMSTKTKKKTDAKGSDKDKKKLPKGSSIYTTSEGSNSEDDIKHAVMSPPRKTSPLKKLDKKGHESESFTSDVDIPEKPKNKKKDSKKNKIDQKHNNSFENDNLLSVLNNSKHKEEVKDITLFDKHPNSLISCLDLDKKLEQLDIKPKKQKSKDKSHKNGQKLKNKKLLDLFSDNEQYVSKSISRLDVTDVYSETFYDSEKLLSNLSNKDNLPPILSDISKEPLFKLEADSIRNDIPSLKDMNINGDKAAKVRNKKHKKENKKKKKNKADKEKESPKEKHELPKNVYPDVKSDSEVHRNEEKIEETSENIKPDSECELNNSGNSVNRNLFEEMKAIKSPKGEGKKKKKEKENQSKPPEQNERKEQKFEPERLSDSDFLSDSDKKQEKKSENKTEETEEQTAPVTSAKQSTEKTDISSADVFDFKEDEDHSFKPIKESHVKIIKPDSYDIKISHDDEKDIDSSNIPIEIQGVEIEYQTEEQDYKDEENSVCPIVETSEVVIEQIQEEKLEKAKPKPRKRKGRKNSGKEATSADETLVQSDLTSEAVSSIEKEQKQTEEIQTEVVHFEAPVSNEQELVIDEGVSLHVDDETDKAVGAIMNEECDETAKAVESILFDDIPTYAITEPVEPTPELDQNYLQPEFAPGLPTGVPQVGTEVETTTASTPVKGKKGRKGRRTKSGNSEALLNEKSNKDVQQAENKQSSTSSSKSFDFFEDLSYTSDISNLHDQNDDDDDDGCRLHIDFDPPKPEPKVKKPRKPKQTKANKMADAAALAAENKMGNLFGNFDNDQNKESTDLNRDSVSSENSELERSKHEDFLFMDREDQRHDSDMMSPDERSTSDDLTSPDSTKVKARRGRKPKNKDAVISAIPRTNSPRSTRTMSPRSPRNADPRSPKYDGFDPKLNGAKALIMEDMHVAENKVGKILTNVFDFDDNDESGLHMVQPPAAATTKQRKPRRKKGETLQSPEHKGMFSSPEHKSEDKLVIGSPEHKLPFNSPDQKAQVSTIDKKMGLFSQSFQPEDQKIEVKTVIENKPDEPLFKAFFEAKPKTDGINPLISRRTSSSQKEITSPTTLIMSNVDKTIDDVSKGLFESTDDESSCHPGEQNNVQKKRQTKKGKDTDDIKSPIKSPNVKSPIKSPMMNHIHSPPPTSHPAVQYPQILPGTGQLGPQAPIGEPLVATNIGMLGQMSPPISMTAKLQGPLQPVQTPVTPVTESQQTPPKPSPESPVKSMMSPSKTAIISSTCITTTASTGSLVVSSVSSDSNVATADTGSMEGILKKSMPGFLVPAISVSTATSVVPGVSTSATPAQTTVVSSATVTTARQQQQTQEQIVLQQQQKQLQLEQQKQAELQKQQEHHVNLKEQELKRKEIEQHLVEQAKLQEQMQNKQVQEKELEMKKEQHKKQKLLEHQKLLQQQYEQLQRQQVIQAAAAAAAAGGAVSQHPQPSMLSPGSLQGPRPSLPSPGEGQPGQRPPISAHHQMPPGPPYGLPGQHAGPVPVRPCQFPPHLAPTQITMQPHLVQPLASHEKPPTSAEMIVKHQQLQQQIAAQQAHKAQAQAIAEQQAQLAKQQAQQAQAHAKQTAQQNLQGKPATVGLQSTQGLPAKSVPAQAQPGKKETELQVAKQGAQGVSAGNRKDIVLQRPSATLGPGVPPPPSKDMPQPGSQEAANQLTQQIKQQLAMSQNHPGGPGPPPHGPAPQSMHGWQMHQIRPEGPPRQPGQTPITTESRTAMPGPIPVIGGNPQSVQRVSPHPPTKSPTVAQTAPSMGLGFSQHQAAAPRAPSPAVAKTAERQASGGGKWSASPGSQRPGQPEVRPRPPSTEGGGAPAISRPEHWVGMNGPTSQAPALGMNPTPRPAHQQPPSAHQQQPDHALQLKRAPAPELPNTKDKFLQQREKQIQSDLQRQQELIHQRHQQEIQRQQQLRELHHAQAQKEVQIHKERERAESLEREKREREARATLTSQSPSDPRQSPAVQRIGYQFVEPRPPSRDGKMPQSPAIVDPRDPRFSSQFPGHHPTDLRIGAAQTSAFSPAAGSSGDAAHMYTQAELQRLQQNGLIPTYPPGLRMLEPHLIPGHSPYMIPGHHLAYMAQQMEHQQHLVDGRPPSRGSSRPPSSQPPARPVSPTQQTPSDRQGQPNRVQGQTMGPQGRDPHPGDGSLLSLLQRYPVMWQGVLGLKNDQCVVQMHFISGFQPLVKMSLPQQAPDGTVQPLRIAQRMRLEQTQLEGVAKRMQMEKDYCMMLALPCGRDHTDIYQQTRAMSTGFIQYLQQKQAAGIVNVADPGSQQPAYVVHIFPPCEFSQMTLSRLGFDLMYQVKDLAHLIVIIATVA